MMLTKKLITDIMLLNEVPKQLLVCATLVGNLNPEAIRIKTFCFLYRCLAAVSQNVQPSSIAFKRTGSACSRFISDPMAALRPMAPKPGTGTCWPPNGSELTMLVIW